MKYQDIHNAHDTAKISEIKIIHPTSFSRVALQPRGQTHILEGAILIRVCQDPVKVEHF